MFYVLLISILNMRFTGKITPIALQNKEQKICSVGGRQGITLTKIKFIFYSGCSAVILYVFFPLAFLYFVNQ
jgi:hypothetical protein